jgi:hypothetical protein
VTVLEVIVASLILTIFLTAVGSCFTISLRIWESSGPGSEADTHAFRAIETLAGKLRRADAGSVTPAAAPPDGSSTIRFRFAEAVSGSAAVWGEEMEYAWELEPEETADGLDNDGDGLVDEGRVVWRMSPGTIDELKGVLVTGVAALLEGELDNNADDNGNGLVDEPGFVVVRATGNLVTVMLTVVRPIRNGDPVLRTVTTTMQLRN